MGLNLFLVDDHMPLNVNAILTATCKHVLSETETDQMIEPIFLILLIYYADHQLGAQLCAHFQHGTPQHNQCCCITSSTFINAM